MVRRSSSFNRAPHRSPLRRDRARVRRPRRRLVAQPAHAHDSPRRGLQPRRAEPRAGQLRRAGVHRGRRRRSGRCVCSTRSARATSAAGSTRRPRARCSARSRRSRSTRRRRSIRGARTRVEQGLRPLDHAELPRGVRHVRRQRHPLQPRVAAARRDLRHAEDHRRRSARSCEARRSELRSRQSRGEARLGLREGLHGRRVADAAAGRARRLRARDRRDALGAGVPRGRRSRTSVSTGATTCRSTRATLRPRRSTC